MEAEAGKDGSGKEWRRTGKGYKAKFSKEEDEKLKNLVAQQQGKNVDWNYISHMFENRNIRQCRERYQNYLDPNLSVADWTEEEDKIIMKKYKEFGPRWNSIGRYMTKRSGNAVRNRYLVLKRHEEKNSPLKKKKSEEEKKEEEVKNDESSFEKIINDIFNDDFLNEFLVYAFVDDMYFV
jgi:hypothetical protein